MTKRTPAGVGILVDCGEKTYCKGCPGPCPAQDKANTRLADYEDTGLSPADVKYLLNAYSKTFGKGVSFDRIQELIKAEREDRVLVVPPGAKKAKGPAGKFPAKTLQALKRMGEKAHREG